MKNEIFNAGKGTSKQTGERQSQNPEQGREETEKRITAGLEEVRKINASIITTLAELKVDLADVRADLAKMRADSAAFRAGLAEIKTIIHGIKYSDFSKLQESSDN